MALFSGKKDKGNTNAERTQKTAQPATGNSDERDVLMRPRITEKATTLAEGNNVYTFEVHPDANKRAVAQAIEALYSVVPIKVNIVSGKPKQVRIRGHKGTKSGVKKAYVHLKEGDRIELV